MIDQDRRCPNKSGVLYLVECEAHQSYVSSCRRDTVIFSLP